LSLSFKSLKLRLLEIILGGLFCYSGYLKLLSPDDFADAVLAYRLLPVLLAGVVAVALPWLEMLAGVFLMVGLKKRSCLLLLTMLTGLFILVMFSAMVRGLSIDCGCGLFSGREVGPLPLLEDGLIFLWAAWLYSRELKLAGEGPAATSGPASKRLTKHSKFETQN
jgi:putative oxidoreductase